MKSLRRWLMVTLASLCFVTQVSAQPALDEEEGKRRFKLGVRLFQEQDITGALTAFEEAYRLNPTPNALLNVALCQRALKRYPEAIQTLNKLLKEHLASVTENDRRAAEIAVSELRPLVAEPVFVVTPPDAILLIDEQPIAGGHERKVMLTLGEHRVRATAPHFRSIVRTETISSARTAIDIKLEAAAGRVVVRAEDDDAAILVDGVVRGYGEWSGDLSSDEDHKIVATKPGFSERELMVRPREEQATTFKFPKLEKASAGSQQPTNYTYSPPPKPKKGPYGLLAASTYYLIGDPDDFLMPDDAPSYRDGASFGARLGYRFIPSLGLEAMIDVGTHEIGPGCYAPPTGKCTALPINKLSYELNTIRTGVNGRYFYPLTRSATTSLVGVAGVGFAIHKITLPPPQEERIPPIPEGTSTGLNAYALLEAGVQFAPSNVLLEVVASFVGEGASNLKAGTPKPGFGAQRIYTEDPRLFLIGAGIRIGYGIW